MGSRNRTWRTRWWGWGMRAHKRAWVPSAGSLARVAIPGRAQVQTRFSRGGIGMPAGRDMEPATMRGRLSAVRCQADSCATVPFPMCALGWVCLTNVDRGSPRCREGIELRVTFAQYARARVAKTLPPARMWIFTGIGDDGGLPIPFRIACSLAYPGKATQAAGRDCRLDAVLWDGWGQG